MENECEYVSSRGILKSCKIFQSNIYSSNPNIYGDILQDVKEGDTLYICNTAIPEFAKSFLPRLRNHIVLVSGDSDELIPYINDALCAEILNSSYILKWFAQNNHAKHPKIVHLPIGMDYHTMSSKDSSWGLRKSPSEQEAEICLLLKSANPFYERQNKCYTTFHFELDRGDRREAYNTIPKDLVFYEPERVTRDVSHKKQLSYAFVISPYGGGTDCHRTWEALILGCIPIIKSSNMDPLFDGLPVLLVDKWSDLSQDLLDKTINEFKNKSFQYEKLNMKYWKNRIANPDS